MAITNRDKKDFKDLQEVADFLGEQRDKLLALARHMEPHETTIADLKERVDELELEVSELKEKLIQAGYDNSQFGVGA